MRDLVCRFVGLLCALLAMVLASIVPGNAQGQTPDLSMPDRVMVASKIYSLVQQYFAHWDGAPRTEVDAAYRRYIDQILQSKDRQEFDLASMRFIASLHNGHTQFFDNAMDGRPIKFRLLEVENRYVVVSSQDSRLLRGAVVLTINGQPADEFVRERAQFVHASNDRLARAHVFSYQGLFPERISITLENGEILTIDRSVRGDVPPSPPITASQGRWLREGQVAYLKVPSFNAPEYERTAIAFVRQYSSARTLIVDVRGNGGGTTPRQLLQTLMNRPWRGWQETTPQRIALFEAQGIPPLQVARDFGEQSPSGDAYQGRVFVLVDRFCGSACEDFVMPFKYSGRGVVVGETTQGSSGNPYRADLGSGISIAVGAVRYRFPDGTAFEGVGIAPDVVVQRRISDIVDGRDRVFERAQELADARQ